MLGSSELLKGSVKVLVVFEQEAQGRGGEVDFVDLI